jgi:hypothetical protein
VDVDAIGAGSQENVTDDLSISYDGATFLPAGKAESILIINKENLHIQKSFINDPAPLGGTVDLQFTINNFTRTENATNIAFTDDLDAVLTGLVATGLPVSACGGTLSGTSTISLTGGTLAAEGSCTFTVTCPIPAGGTAGTYVNETTAITADLGGSPFTGNTASDNLIVSPSPTLTKSFKDYPVVPGSTTELEFTLTNTSATHDLTAATFFDDFATILQTASVLPPTEPCGVGSSATFTPFSDPGGGNPVNLARLTISGANLAPGGSCTFSITLDVSADAPGGTYPNITSDVTGTVDGTTVTGSPATDDLLVLSAPQISKTFLSSPNPGETVDLEFTIGINGNAPTDATNIAFMDDLTAMGLTGLVVSAGGSQSDICGTGSSLSVNGSNDVITFSGGTLSPGGSCSFTVTLTVPANAAPATYTNTTNNVTATVSGTSVTGNTAQDDLLVAVINFTKEFLTDPVIPGGSSMLRFTIEVDANSPTDATNILFTDNLSAMLSGTTISAAPANGSCGAGSVFSAGGGFLSMTGGTLSPGGSCTFDIEVNIPVSANNNTYSNITSNMSAVVDGNTVLVPPALDELTVNNELIQLEKSFTGNPYPNGSTSANVLFTVTNLDGVNALDGVAFTDDLEAFLSGSTYKMIVSNSCGASITGTSTLDVSNIDLAAGASCTFEVELNIPGSASSGTYVNTTSAPTGTIGGLAVEGQAASADLVIGDVGFSKVFSGSVAAGDTTDLTFTITNFGSTALTDLDFSDDLDAMLTGAVSASGTMTNICGAGSTLSGTSTLTLDGGNLAANGGTCSFTVKVSVPCSAATGTYPNTTSELREQNIPFTGVSATANLSVTGSLPPSITTCPPTSNVEGCDTGDIMNGSLTALAYSTTEVTITEAQFTAEGGTFSGTPAVIKYQDSSTGTCPIVVTRTYTITNDCGTTNCSQTINIDDDTDPVISTCPPTRNVEGCDTGDIMNGGLTALAYSETDVTITNTQFTNEGGAITEACGYTIKYKDSSTGTCPIVVTRTFTVTDDCGNPITCDQTINIDDTTDPVISTCPPTRNVEGCDTGDIMNGGLTALAYSETDVTITDTQFTNEGGAITEACGYTIKYKDSSTGTCPIVITRTFTVTDDCGNPITCDQTINIDDTTDPVITTCPPTRNVEGCDTGDIMNGSLTALAYSETDVTITNTQFTNEGGAITEACGYTIKYKDSSTGTCPIVITRTFTVTDDCGNPITCDQTINIDDDTAPSITGTLMTLNEEGCVASAASAAYTMVSELEAAGVMISDVCTSDANLVVTYSDASTGTCPIVVTRTYTVKDACGNGTNATQTINVDDSTAPSITGTLMTLNEEGCTAGAASAAYTMVSELEAAGVMISDVCTSDANLVVTYSDASTGTCPIVVTRTYTVKDACGNGTNATQTINVNDTTVPTPLCQPVTVELNSSGLASLTATQVDNGSSDLCSGVSLSIDITSFDCNDLGDHTVTLTVTDDCNNVNTCTAIVTVEDNIAPVVTCKDATIQLDATGNVILSPFKVYNSTSDNCAIATLSVSPNTFDCMDIGTHTVTLTATDYGGNPATCTATVTVEDTMAPIAKCKDHTVQLDNSGVGTLSVSDVDDGSSDNCGIATSSLDLPASFDCDDIGTHLATLSLTDVNGNSSSCTATVTVVDDMDPEAKCKDITITCPGGIVTIDPSEVDDGSTDNCSFSLSLNQTILPCSSTPVTVTLTATDASGNVDDCTSLVTFNVQTGTTSLSINNVSKLEGNWFGFTFYQFEVERTGGVGATSVDYATADGTAEVANNDYIPATGTLNWTSGGSNFQYFTVLVRKDNFPEMDEIFYVNLSNPTGGAVIGNGQGEGEILDDDTPSPSPLVNNDDELAQSHVQISKYRPTLFPNPTQEELFISLPNSWLEDSQNVKAELYDNSGKMMRSFDLSQQESKIEVYDLRNGMYHLVFFPKNGEIISERFVKMD